MANTISPKECVAWRDERHYNINQLILKMLENGKHIPQEGAAVISEKRILTSRIKTKSNVLSLEQQFAPEFKKYSGKKADTAKIFEKVIGRTASRETVTTL